MKFIHLSDLHLGISLNQYNLIDDQEFILDNILAIIKSECPDGIIIAGDIYDKSIATVEATNLFSKFITNLANLKINTFIISGNHDGADRLAFASEIIRASNIFISPVYNGIVEPIRLNDEFGPLNVYMLPFIKPVHVRTNFPDAKIASYNDAMEVALSGLNVDTSQRNILITHQYIAGAETCESELTLVVGTTEQISGSLFDDFDYVALGHLHRAQNVSPTIRYCGTPLKYSFSEAKDTKSVTVVTLQNKGEVEIREIPLKPLHQMYEIKDSLSNILDELNYNEIDEYDFVKVKLTDEEEIPDALQQLRLRFKNVLHIEYDIKQSDDKLEYYDETDGSNKNPAEIFAEFYNQINQSEISEEQIDFIKDLLEQIEQEDA